MNSIAIPPHLDADLLGGFRLRVEGSLVEGIRSPRSQALLVYLLLNRSAPHPRQHLAFLLWPESTESQARTNLRHVLHDLRRTLPGTDRLLRIDAREVRWKEGVCLVLDVSRFEEHLASARRAVSDGQRLTAIAHLEDAVRLYHGDLHPACYEPWIEPERGRLRDACLGALEQLVQLLTERESIPEAIGYATQLVQRNPLQERGYLALMRLYEARDNHAAVLRVFHQCRATLARELHVEPGPGIRAIHKRVERAAMATSSPQSGSGPGRFEDPLVGRADELTRMQDGWRHASHGVPHLLLLTGDPGIGKTRLAEEFLGWAAAQGIPSARSRSHEAEGRLAWAPVVGWLRSPALRDGIRALDPVWLGDLARILPELRAERPDLPNAGSLGTGWGRRNFLEAVDRAVLAAPPPLVLLLDDIQWTDSGTLEWIGHLMRSSLRSPLLLVATMRTEFLRETEPVADLLLELEARAVMSRIALDPLDLESTTLLAGHLFANAVGGRLAHRLHRETEGNPLFIVETIRSGVLDGIAWEDPERPVPTPVPVQNIIAHRLGRISRRARAVIQCMAVIGRSCPLDILARASTCPEDELADTLDDLWHRRIVSEPEGGRYDFSHDKIRSVALSGIPPARRRQIHRRVAEALTALRGATPETIASQVASHWEHADMIEPAIASYELAAEDARRRFAEREAIGHARRALDLCTKLPAERDDPSRRARLQVLLGFALVSQQGWAAPETGQAFRQAATIGAGIDPRDHCFNGLWGLQDFHQVRGELREATEVDQAMGILAEEKGRPDWRAVTRQVMTLNVFHAGRIDEAASIQGEIDAEHLGRMGTMGQALAVLRRAYGSHLSWHQGHRERALAEGRATRALAESSANPLQQAIALAYEAMLHQFCRDIPETLSTAEAAIAFCERHEVPYYRAWAAVLRGWATAATGAVATGLAGMERALKDLESTGAGLRKPYYLGLLSEGHLLNGDTAKAEEQIEGALDTGRCTEERWCEPELLRLRGTILRVQGRLDEAEASLREGISLARTQGAFGREPRLATALAGLLIEQDRKSESRTLLTDALGRFTEGSDSGDLAEAAALLGALGGTARKGGS